MTSDDRQQQAIEELWAKERQERQEIMAQVTMECKGLLRAALATGGSGSDGTDDSNASTVEWPADFDHREYQAWAAEVDEIYAAEQLAREQALDDERRNDA